MANADSWLDFLQNQGAEISAGMVTNYPSRCGFNPGLSLFALSTLSSLDIIGPEAKNFLQGQVTCDVNGLNANRAGYGAQCNPKGRVIFNFLAMSPQPECVRLRLPAAMVDLARQSLGKYMVFSKAEIAAIDQFPIIGLVGPEAENTITQLFGGCPSDSLGCLATSLGIITKVGADRFEVWLESSDSQQTWIQLTEIAPVRNSHYWFAAEIQAGIATIYPQTSEEFVPQTINLQYIDGISFTKGCYTGQEVVARMKYLGKQKRHSYRAIVHGAEIPAPGCELYLANSEQSVGKVVNAAQSDTGNIEILACLVDSAYTAGNVNFGAGGYHFDQFADLPYELD